MATSTNTPTFAELGATFNDATRVLEGGVWKNVVEEGGQGLGSVYRAVNDLTSVQSGLQAQIQANQFTGETLIHVQEIVAQLNQEIEAVQESVNGGQAQNNGAGAVGSGTVFGADAAKAINDIHRDIIDIVQGDANLAALATQGGANGFQPVPPLLSPATPFADNAAQTAFLAQWASDSNNLGAQAVNLVGSHDNAAINALIGQIQAFENNANTFVNAQGGVFTARFANELALNGNTGVEANDLIQGLQSGNADLVKAAAAALAANASDVSGNNAPAGTTPTPPAVTAANAPHANLAEIGAIFDDASLKMIGGIDETNKASVLADLHAVQKDLQQLINDHPALFGGLTGIHAETIVQQLTLEQNYVKEVGVNPDAARGLNDVQLDIIDIVQGDTNLANMANQGGVSGFTPLPDALNPTPKYQDNADQTTFWATFISQSNSLGQQAEKLVGSHDTHAINTLIDEIKAFNNYTANFDAAQGGIFGARFDNELLTTGTLGAEVKAMIKGLHTGNAALVTAAAEEMHANAADVGGNNVPISGGTYNPDGLTVAQVLSTAGTAIASAGQTNAGGGNTNANSGPGNSGGAGTGNGPGGANDAGTGNAAGSGNAGGPAGADDNHGHHGHHFDFSHVAQHFEHMWG
jgi:hypothetical protein